MNKQKLNYLAPEAETLVIRFEENIMSPGNDVNGTQRSNVVNAGWDEWDA